jgi:ABC-type multidrug transport system ATPase subunit
MEVSSKSSSVIRVEGMKKHFSRSFSLEIDELTLRPGTIHLLVGPNGAGKTTLLRCIMGLTRYSGSIVQTEVERIGYAPEAYIMPSDLTLEEFLHGLGRIRKTNGHGSEFEDWLEWLELGEARNKPIGRLSSGTRQKINLLQALIHRPSVLLLDEPLKALDKESQKKCLDRIQGLRQNTLILISTHEPELFRKRTATIHHLEAGRLIDP